MATGTAVTGTVVAGTVVTGTVVTGTAVIGTGGVRLARCVNLIALLEWVAACGPRPGRVGGSGDRNPGRAQDPPPTVANRVQHLHAGWLGHLGQ